MTSIFEERVDKSDKGEEIIWYTEKLDTGDRVKIREHMVEHTPVKADATFCVDDAGPSTSQEETGATAHKIKIISRQSSAVDKPEPKMGEVTAIKPKKVDEPKTIEPAKVQVSKIAAPKTQTEIQTKQPAAAPAQAQPSILKPTEQIPAVIIYGKEVKTTEEKQIQKEKQDEVEITRKITDITTVEQEHKATAVEKKVVGVKPTDKVAPRFTQKIQPYCVFERETAKFECQFEGKPTPKVTWYRENFEIQSSNDFKIITTETKTILIIQEVYFEDAGIFTVMLENEAGIAKCSSNLVVQGKSESLSVKPPITLP